VKGEGRNNEEHEKNEEMTGRGMRAGGERRKRIRRSGKTEIQFERCMLDPLTGPAHFKIGFVLLQIRFALRVHDERVHS